jgi:hypothetical protein
MVDETLALVGANRSRLHSLVGILGDAELRVRADKSYREAQRAIDEWRVFVLSIGRATRAARDQADGRDA